MDSTKWISKKIAIVGSFAVGKTSLISRFVEGKFPESYVTTIGLKVDKKTLEHQDYRLDLVIWDIAGQENFTKIPHFYLNGSHGVIFVTDLTRPETWEPLKAQMAILKGILPDAAVVLAANKKDLLEAGALQRTLAAYPIQPEITVSAKTGEQVEEMFRLLAAKLIHIHESLHT
ncbi:MAG: Rab family GTPase [Bacteroidia bacterium]|jgi:small GTP-binding protein|nr:Rab family GTPase [Bacteroidia bacterium]